MTPNAKHLEILAEVMKRKTIELAALVDVTDCLAAMQILQLRIDELEKENERLKEQIKMHSHITAEQSIKLDKLNQSIKRQRGDYRLDEIEGKDF